SFRDAQRLTGFVAVVFPQVCRFLDSIGVRYLVISKSQLDGREVDLICITHAKRVGVKADTAPMSETVAPRLVA
ncbi:MAG: hypothetical protein AAGA78_14085, partial [Pseudomonadota bacterium]